MYNERLIYKIENNNFTPITKRYYKHDITNGESPSGKMYIQEYCGPES